MVIYLESYRKAKAVSKALAYCHEEERMCVNSNPAVRAFAMSCYQTPEELSPDLPDDSSPIDPDAFLDRAYALATQV